MRPPRRNRRLLLALVVLVLAGGATALSLMALKENVSFFRTPSEIAEAPPSPGERVRLGGLVEEGSVHHREGTEVIFTITDGAASMDVSYAGALPSLFREGQGVIAEGAFTNAGAFEAARVLAKHDEDYTPRELEGVVKNATTS
jgi:cytochrome c-type biogenesis protein CcmE